ncbi:MAG: hypothetical protein LBL82_03095 [Oscillospiraceae bacterium]|nr:hypothetical protein [Oscillospiraceae bacterium]
MNLITCNSNCKYQVDGYCELDKPSEVSNSTLTACPYFKQNTAEMFLPSYRDFSEPGRLH